MTNERPSHTQMGIMLDLINIEASIHTLRLNNMTGGIEVLERHREALQEKMKQVRNGKANGTGRPLMLPPPDVTVQVGGRYGWSTDPEERKRQMQQRREVIKAKRKLALEQPWHPRQAGHPAHEEWLTKMRRRTKAHWKRMSPEQREGHIAKMIAGRRARGAEA